MNNDFVDFILNKIEFNKSLTENDFQTLIKNYSISSLDVPISDNDILKVYDISLKSKSFRLVFDQKSNSYSHLVKM